MRNYQHHTKFYVVDPCDDPLGARYTVFSQAKGTRSTLFFTYVKINVDLVPFAGVDRENIS